VLLLVAMPRKAQQAGVWPEVYQNALIFTIMVKEPLIMTSTECSFVLCWAAYLCLHVQLHL
jgi:hypothetical protein